MQHLNEYNGKTLLFLIFWKNLCFLPKFLHPTCDKSNTDNFVVGVTNGESSGDLSEVGGVEETRKQSKTNYTKLNPKRRPLGRRQEKEGAATEHRRNKKMKLAYMAIHLQEHHVKKIARHN